VFYLIIIRFIPFLYKNNFLTNFINCLLFSSLKIFRFENFFIFFFLFSSFTFLHFLFLLSFLLFFLAFSFSPTERRTQHSSPEQPAAPSSPLLQPSLSSWPVHGAPTSTMAALLWRVSHKLFFFVG
jgi:hypothetical protein